MYACPMVYIDKRKTCVTTNLENYKRPVVSRIIVTVIVSMVYLRPKR